MNRKVNKNLLHLKKSYSNPNIKGAVLEGSSRSGKTISTIDFIIYLCSTESNLTINIVRDTYNSFKTTLYPDINKRLKDFGLPSPFDDSKEVASFNIFDNQINFLGADKPSKFEGASADIWYFNEILDIQQMIFDLSEMRCRRFWIADYNPKAINHWVFDRILKRSDIAYCHSVFTDNPFISKIEREKILSYEPTAKNMAEGTADAYMWSVYGLGKRAVSDQIIFKNWDFYDIEPKAYDSKIYGLDFGFTNDPTTVVQVIEDKYNYWIKEIFYEYGTGNPKFKDDLTNPILASELIKILDRNVYCVCDSAEQKSIKELRIGGVNAIQCDKGKDSVKFGIDKMKSKKIWIHRNSLNLIEEFRQYHYPKDKNGIILNVPVDKNNHCIDACRYAITKFNKSLGNYSAV